jgi:hypothetical protein
MTKPPSIDDKALAAIDVTGAPLAKSRRSLSPQPRAHSLPDRRDDRDGLLHYRTPRART